MKKKVKQKVSASKTSASQTGGGPPAVTSFDDVETEILNMIPPTVTEGLVDVMETPAIFLPNDVSTHLKKNCIS